MKFDPTSTYEKHALWEGITNININCLIANYFQKMFEHLFLGSRISTIKKGRIMKFDPTSTYEKHALWEGMTIIQFICHLQKMPLNS
jgi:uncharacterized membrane protein